MAVALEPSTAANYRAWLKEQFLEHADDVFAAYPANSDADVRAAFISLSNDYVRGQTVHALARDTARAGQKAYLYYFSYPGKGQTAGLGSYHTLELAFVGGGYFRKARWGEPDAEDWKLAGIMSGYRTQFTATGNPIRQLLTESVLLAVAGGICGVGLATWGLNLLVALSPKAVPRLAEIRLDWRVLMFALGASLLTGIVFGALPALTSARVNLNETLKEGGRDAGAGASQRTRGALVSAEVALALVVMVSAGLLVKSFWRLQQVNPGFDATRLTTMLVWPTEAKYVDVAASRAFIQELNARLEKLPGTEGVAISNDLPIRGSSALSSSPAPLSLGLPSIRSSGRFFSKINSIHSPLLFIPRAKARGETNPASRCDIACEAQLKRKLVRRANRQPLHLPLRDEKFVFKEGKKETARRR